MKLGGYRDGTDKVQKICDDVFTEAQSFYQDKNHERAKEEFESIQDVNKDAAGYLILIEAHGKTQEDCYDDYDGMKILFERLTALGPLADARELTESSAFILLRLEGKWFYNSVDSIEFHYSAADSMWYENGFELDGKNRKLEYPYLFVFLNDAWRELYQFEFRSENKINVTLLYTLDKTTVVFRRR